MIILTLLKINLSAIFVIFSELLKDPNFFMMAYID